MIPQTRSRNRIVVLLTLFMALIVITVALIGFRTWRPKSWPHNVSDALRRAGVADATVGSVAVTPWRGVTIASISGTISDGRRQVSFSVSSAELRWYPWQLMRNAAGLRRIFRTRSNAGISVASALDLLTEPTLRSTMRDFALTNVEIALTANDSAVFAFRRGRIDGTFIPQGVTLATFELSADTLFAARRLPLTAARARFALSADSLRMDSLSAQLFGGRAGVRGAFDIAGARTGPVTVSLESFDIGAWRRYSSGDSSLTGIADLTLTLQSAPLHADSLIAEGTLRATDLTVTNLTVFSTLGRMFGTRVLDRVAFDSLSADYALADTILTIHGLNASGSPLRFFTRGWLSFGGRTRQTIRGSLDATLMRRLDPLARASMIPAKGGAGQFAGTLSGTLAQPVISLEKRMLEQAVEGMFREIEEEFRETFSR